MTTSMEDARRILITDGQVLLGTGADAVPEALDILVVDGVIAEIGPELGLRPELAGVERLDASGRMVAPGMINAHYHSHDALLKGTMEEEPLESWRLLALPPQYPARSREEITVRTLLGAFECLRAGITTVQDMVTLYPFDPEHFEAVVEAYELIGLRAVVGLQYADLKGVSTIPYWQEVFPEELHHTLSTAAEPDSGVDQLAYLEEEHLKGEPRDLVTWALGPSAPERCSPALIARTVELAERYDLQIFTHIYESKSMALQARLEYPEHGGSLIRRLQQEGMLGPRLNLAHSVWLLDEEIDILAETGTNVVLNPLSNLKLKSGIPPIRRLEDAGVSFGLGCDNSSCSDSQNMFHSMKLFSLLAAVSDPEPGPGQAEPAWRAATRGGAHALGRDDDLGRIAVGYRADLILLDLADPALVPLNSAVRQLVYTESGRAVSDVVVDGRVVIRDGRLVTIDQQDLVERVRDVMPELLADFAAASERVAGLRAYLQEAHRRIWAQEVGMNRLFTGEDARV